MNLKERDRALEIIGLYALTLFGLVALAIYLKNLVGAR